MSTISTDFRDRVPDEWAQAWRGNSTAPKHMIQKARAELAAEDKEMAAKMKRQGDMATAEDTDRLLVIEGKHQILRDLEEGRSDAGAHPGFPASGGGGRTSNRQRVGGGDLLGQISGLGDEFLHNLGGGDPVRLQAAIDGTSGGTMVQPFFDPQIRELPQRHLFLRSLIPTTTTETSPSDSVSYLRQTVATQNAAVVSAGNLKPTSTFTVERLNQRFTTIAHVSEAQDRMLLSDFASLAQFLDNELRLGVLLAEESEILNGNGSFPHIPGITTTAGIQTQAKGADPGPDAIHKAVTKIRVNGFREPNGVAFHPTDFENVRLLKTSYGEYIAGDALSADPNKLWGMDVVVSPLMTQGTAIVAYWNDMQLWEREAARISFTEAGLGDSAGQELFTRNQVRWRAEERIAFAVLRPASVCTVTGL